MFNVMLAKSAPATEDTINMLMGTHYFDLKIDGVRDVIAINKGTVRIQNRNGVDTTNRYPDIVAGCIEQFGTDAQLVLDGEMVVKVNGRPDFKATSMRDRLQDTAKIAARVKTLPATFISFDVLYQDGVDYRNAPFVERKERLDVVLGRAGAGVVQKNVGSMDGHAMMALVREHHLEGVIAKRLDSRYKAGKGSDWLKIKVSFTASVVITGKELGEGARSSTFGALNIGMYDASGNIVPTGKVGTGFSQVELNEILGLLDKGVTLVGEVGFANVGVDNYNLRFPTWLGLRNDVKPNSCTLDQLDDVPKA